MKYVVQYGPAADMTKARALFPEHKGYGLGIGIFNGWLGHTGELPGYNAGAFYLPSRRATIVMIVNSDVGHDGKNPIPVLFNKLSAIVTPENASGT